MVRGSLGGWGRRGAAAITAVGVVLGLGLTDFGPPPARATTFLAKKSDRLPRLPFKDGAVFCILIQRDSGEPAYTAVDTSAIYAVYRVAGAAPALWTLNASNPYTIHPGNARRITLRFDARTVTKAAPGGTKTVFENRAGSGNLDITLVETATPAESDDIPLQPVEEVDVAPCP